MSASFWSAVASEARHRFGFGPHVTVRKRRRRCALPAHSKACGASAYTSALARRIDQQVYAIYLPAPRLLKMPQASTTLGGPLCT